MLIIIPKLHKVILKDKHDEDLHESSFRKLLDNSISQDGGNLETPLAYGKLVRTCGKG
jgi:hypothetical protein